MLWVMLLSRMGAVFLSLCLAAPTPAPISSAGAAALPPQALSRAQMVLLVKNKYEIQPDGKVLSPDGSPVADTDLTFLLKRMSGAQRLKAFVELDILLTNSDGERHLSPAEKEQLRRIVKENWPYFSLTTRKDFRNYFSVEELEGMNADPPASDADDAPFTGMKDPEPSQIPQEELAAAAAPEPPLPPPAAFFPPILQPLTRPLPQVERQAPPPPPPAPAPAAPRQEAPVVAVVPQAAPAVVTQTPRIPEPSAPAVMISESPKPLPTIAPSPAPAPAPAPSAPPAPATPPAASITPSPAPAQSLVKPIASGKVEEVATNAPALASAAAPKLAQALALSTLVGGTKPPPAVIKPMLPNVLAVPVKPRAITKEAFEKFLVEAPYNREEKDILRVVSDKTPDFARDRALAIVVDVMPQIVQDSLRAGLDRRATLLAYETGASKSYTIALNPTALLYSHKKMFFGESTSLLPDAPKAYGAMHLGAPAVEALKRDAVPTKELNGDWGATKVFSDGSRRAAYTQVELAGEVLRALLLLDARRQGWDASTYASEVYARVAQMALYAKVFGELHEDAFLDPDLRAEFRLWLDHPVEYRDFLVHTLSSGRVGLLDVRKGGAESQSEFALEARGTCPASADEDAAARAAAERDSNARAAQAFSQTGLAEDDQLKAAQAEIASQPSLDKPSPESCGQVWLDESAGARQAAALKSQMEQAVRKFRDGRSDGK